MSRPPLSADGEAGAEVVAGAEPVDGAPCAAGWERSVAGRSVRSGGGTPWSASAGADAIVSRGPAADVGPVGRLAGAVDVSAPEESEGLDADDADDADDPDDPGDPDDTESVGEVD